MGSYLDRYLDGECEAVWNELTACEIAALQPPLLDDATGIAETLVDRIVHNAKIVGQYLLDAGYEFKLPGPFVVPADETTLRGVQEIEKEFGDLPLFLKMWWSKVDQLNHLPTESFRTLGRGCATRGIFPVQGILINPPGECLSVSRRREKDVKSHIKRSVELGIDGEEEYYTDSPNLVLGPFTSANDPVGYRLPLKAVDGVSHQKEVDEDEETLVDWLRFYFLKRGGLGWNFFGYVTNDDGTTEFRQHIHPAEDVEAIVRSMELIPF